MFRIVEDDCPPIPERFSDPLVAFLKECFHKDPGRRPSAEQLFEHEWLKNHWGLNKVGSYMGDLNPLDHETDGFSIPIPHGGWFFFSFLILYFTYRTCDLRIAYRSLGG
jgi:serine/threonine protein kinase